MESRPAASAVRWSSAGAAAVGLLFLARALAFLYRAHPQEDAYILFGYVKRFVAGEGIVFYPGGPHAEGATDFLWFLALSMLHWTGLDIAVAAAVLNALGGALLGGILAGVVAGSRTRVSAALLLPLLPAALAGGAVAALVGFGSLFYAGVAAWCLVLSISALEGGSGDGLKLPCAGLLLALIRPDGVILGGACGLVGWIAVARAGRARAYAARALLAVGVGAAYFAWRWSYFGLFLPLPLYVKGHATQDLAGARPTLDWFLHAGGAWPLLVALLALLWIGGRGRPRVATLAVAAAPFLVHLAVLSLARQSQNVAFRFQAPAQAALLVLLVLAGVRAAKAAVSTRARALVALLAVAGAGPGLVLYLQGMRTFEATHTYVDVFAPRLGAILEPEDKVALCDQAGRIPYWSNAGMFDLVGLNTARTALAPPDQAYLRELDPDLLLLYLGRSTTRLDGLLSASKEDLVPIDRATLTSSLRPEHRALYDHGLGAYEGTSSPDQACNVIAMRYLADADHYDLYAVRYMESFRHVYALKRGHPRAGRILEALRESLRPESYRSYAQLAGLPLAP